METIIKGQMTVTAIRRCGGSFLEVDLEGGMANQMALLLPVKKADEFWVNQKLDVHVTTQVKGT